MKLHQNEQPEQQMRRTQSGFRLVKLFPIRLGNCIHSCAFCGQSTQTERVAMPMKGLPTEREIETTVDQACREGTHELLVSMPNIPPDVESPETEIAIRTVKLARNAGLDVCIDFGIIDKDFLNCLFDAGASIFMNSVQTSRELFGRMCTSHNYESKVESLQLARSMGYSTRSGGIIGLGETQKQRTRFFEELETLPCESISACLFQPMPGTPMANHSSMTSSEALNALIEIRKISSKPIFLLGGREKVLNQNDASFALQFLDGTTVGNYLFTVGETREQLEKHMKGRE